MFYGWVIVGLAFVSQFVVAGSVIQCFPVFLVPFTEAFGIGRAEASLPVVAMLVCGFGLSPLVGRAVSRFPIRNVMLAGALAMALGCFGLSRATQWWQVIALYGTTGSFAMSALGVVSCNLLVVNWFERRRSMALGIAMIGMSISGAVMVPTATWALTNWGWRSVYVGFACAAVALMPLIAWLAVTRPSDVGLLPDGDASAVPGESALQPVTAPAAQSMRALLSSKLLWLIAASCGLVYFGSMGIMNHGLAFALDRGIEPLRASALLAAISVGAACGKLMFGRLADTLGERGALLVAISVSLVGLSGLIGLSNYESLVASSGIYGLGIGGVAPLQAALLARGFGTRNFGPVMGLMAPLTMPFQVTGPPLAGLIFDTQGSYDMALWIFFATTLLSALAVSWMRLPSHSPDSAADAALPGPRLAESS